MKHSVLSLLLATLALAALGCGGAAPIEKTTFAPEDHLLFENGADFVTNPDEFEGQWRDGWMKDLESRVRHADAIVVVTVNTLRNDEDPSGATTLRLATTPSKRIFGRPPDGKELWLVSKDGDPGYRTVNGEDQRLIGAQFVVFLKTMPGVDGGEPTIRWHLSPATNALEDAIHDAMSTQAGRDRNN